MTTYLLPDASGPTDNNTHNFGNTSGTDAYCDAWQRQAAYSGTITSVELKLKRLTSGSWTVSVAIYDDDAGEPGTMLGSVSRTFTDPLTDFTWESFDGFSVDVTAGATYYVVPFTVAFNVNLARYDSDDDTPKVYYSETTGYVTAPPDPWADAYPTADNWRNGIGIRAAGVTSGSVSLSRGLEFHLTGIMGFGDTSAPYYGRLADPQAGEVVIPLNDSRTASVTVSAFDPVVETLAALTQVPYAVHLKAYYNGHLVFWGPIKVRSGDFVAGTVRFDAVDMSLRLIKHFIREGDVTLEGTVDATTGEGSLPISHTGMRLLRDAGETTSLPPLGIDDGTNDFAPSTVGVMGVRRGDQVWNTWLQMSQTLGPDFELEPRDDGDGYYAQLNTFTRQGTDKSGAVQFHHGNGRQNLEALSFVEGEEYTNLAHVLDKDLKYRETRTNASAILRTGPYIAWDATDFDTSHTSEADSRAVLDAHGDDILAAYSVPLIALNLTLFADTEDGYHYLDDYGVGDTIGVAGKAGFLELPEAPYRVTRVTLSQDGDNVRQGLEVVADRTSGDTIDGTDA